MLCDVIRVELLWRDIQDRLAVLPAGTPATARRRGQPRLRPDTAVAAFGCPVLKVRRLILAGQPVDDVPMETTYYVIQGHPRDQKIRGRRVLERAGRVLGACDGATAPAEMAARLALPVAEVDRLLQQASAAGILLPR